MDTQSLQTFITLAEYRNFTKTADALFIAQSTVTNRIAELEKEIGKQLFDRNKRKVTLSKEGETFLFYAKRILELTDMTMNVTAGKIFVTAFLDFKTYKKFSESLAWETEVWIAEMPEHMIHLNGHKFLGPR